MFSPSSKPNMNLYDFGSETCRQSAQQHRVSHIVNKQRVRKMLIHNWQPTSQVFCVIAVVVLLNSNSYDFTANVHKNYFENASMSFFRFRDFEPRAAVANEALNVPLPTAREYGASQGKENTTRKSRGFHFHTTNSDVVVDMELIVPFLKIPIKRSMEVTQTALHNLVNLNIGTLLFSGAFVVIGAVMVTMFKALATPVLYTGFKKNSRAAGTALKIMDPFGFMGYSFNNNGTNSNGNSIKANEWMNMLEWKLHENGIDMSSCAQKSICNYLKRAAIEVRQGNATGTQKIIDGFSNLEMVKSYLSGTAVQNAIDSATRSANCEQIYRNCKWPPNEHKVMQLVNTYLKFLNG